MTEDTFNINNKVFLNNNNLLLEIVNDIKIINSKEKAVNKKLKDIINRLNSIINDNQKKTELIKEQFTLMKNHFNKIIEHLKFNIRINKEIKYDNGARYVGQVLSGLKEGKGIMYWKSGSKYDGEFKNDKKEGKGTMYYNNGTKYEGDFSNDKYGDRYEDEDIIGQSYDMINKGFIPLFMKFDNFKPLFFFIKKESTLKSLVIAYIKNCPKTDEGIMKDIKLYDGDTLLDINKPIAELNLGLCCTITNRVVDDKN